MVSIRLALTLSGPRGRCAVRHLRSAGLFEYVRQLMSESRFPAAVAGHIPDPKMMSPPIV